MNSKDQTEGQEAARLDRVRTGDATNAQTDDLKQELNQETEQLQRKYVQSDQSKEQK